MMTAFSSLLRRLGTILVWAVLVGCGQVDAGSESQTSPSKTSQLNASPAQKLGTITLEIPPSSAELCQERHKTLNKVIQWKAQKILEYCNEHSFGECAMRDECVKSVMRTVEPHELTLSLTASQLTLETQRLSDFERNFFIANKGQTSQNSFTSGLTIQFSFTWKFGGPSAVKRVETCISPLETEIGEHFVSSLLTALDQAHLFHKNDPCRRLATQDDLIPRRPD